jgi:hypothetical protein
LQAKHTALFDLTANEEVTMLHYLYWHPLYGWVGTRASVLECWEMEPLSASYLGLSYSGSEEDLFFVFGRVDRMEIASIKISLQSPTYLEGEQTQTWIEDASEVTTESEWTQKGGHCYFVKSVRPKNSELDFPIKVVLTAYDDKGQEVYFIEAVQGIFFGLS